MFADLHIHSWHSDGTFSPMEIIETARRQNISLISISDHNSIASYTEIENLRGVNDITIIPGVEVTSVMDNIEYHILAYGFDMQNKVLNDLLRYNRDINIDEGKKLIERIAADYPNVSSDEFLIYERNRKNGGWASIDYLMTKGLATDWQSYTEFVRKYASPPEKEFLLPMDVIKAIHDAKGYAVLAHMCNYVKPDIAEYEREANQFYNMGIDGFECYYPKYNSELTEYLVKFCRERGLMITAGSDEHGSFIGSAADRYIGAVKVNIEQLNLKNLINSSNEGDTKYGL